jgi:hypothetical protein
MERPQVLEICHESRNEMGQVAKTGGQMTCMTMELPSILCRVQHGVVRK